MSVDLVNTELPGAPAPVGLADTVRGFGMLVVSALLGQLLGFAALAFVTRRIGAPALGGYAFAVTLAGYFGLLANGGLGYVGMRDAAKDPARMSAPVSETLTLQAVIALASYGVLVALAPAITPNPRAAALVPIVGLTIILTAATLDWILLVTRKRAWVAWARLAGQVCYAALVPVFVTASSGPRPYAWLNCLGVAVTAAIVAVAVIRRGQLRYVRPSLRGLARRLRRSGAIVYSLAMVQIYTVADIILLGYLSTSRSVGIYAAASRLPLALVLLANLWLQAFFPDAVSRLRADPAAFRADLSRVISAATVTTMAIAGGAAITAPRLMPGMFGGAFRAASTPFAILAGAMSLVFVEAVLSNVLIAGSKDRTYATLLTVAAAGNVALNVLLVPSLAATGSALATLVTEVFLVGATLACAARIVGLPTLQWARVGRGAVSAGLMCLVLALTRSASVWLSIAAGAITFAVAVAVTRPFDPSLWRSPATGVAKS